MVERMNEQLKFSQNPLVLLHGWGLNHQVWSQLMLALPTELDIHTPDLPGFGLSPCPASYDIDSVWPNWLSKSRLKVQWWGGL